MLASGMPLMLYTAARRERRTAIEFGPENASSTLQPKSSSSIRIGPHVADASLLTRASVLAHLPQVSATVFRCASIEGAYVGRADVPGPTIDAGVLESGNAGPAPSVQCLTRSLPSSRLNAA